MSIKQARLIVNKLIVNAHKHNLLITNSFILQQRVCMFILNNMKTTTKINQKSRERERERECSYALPVTT